MSPIRPLAALSFLALTGAGVGVLFCMTPAREDQPQPRKEVVAAGPRADGCWQVDEVRPGMKGFGLTVMKGTHVDTFQAEVIGVLKNTSPGRDMVLCRLTGLDLEKTGIIAGMSGSPVYLQG